MAGLHQFSVQEAQNAKLGQAGYVYIDQAGTDNTGTAAAGVEYVAVTCLEAGTIATTTNDTSLYPNLAAPMAAGTTVYGRWNKVTVSGANGTMICYKG